MVKHSQLILHPYSLSKMFLLICSYNRTNLTNVKNVGNNSNENFHLAFLCDPIQSLSPNKWLTNSIYYLDISINTLNKKILIILYNANLIFFRCQERPTFPSLYDERKEGKEDERVLSVVISNGLMSSLHNVKLCSGWSLDTAAR